ncbi:beta-lactamase/transpeptidase-like protein [Neoconidiobolus thromboides FSU 785]|nr:beta-lactamase/transpeptidase-like protein [Neoconidiobolus thromboides FSU 785]
MISLLLFIVIILISLIYLGNKLLNEAAFSPWYYRYFNLWKPKYPIHGQCEEEYKEVKEVFRNSFERGIEVGASVAVYNKGKLVVELYGGYQDYENKELFNETTLTIVFSSSKFMASAVIAKLVDQGLLAYNEKICTYWPEFSNGGKEEVTLTDLLRHEGGLPYLLDPEPAYEDVYDSKRMKKIIENTTHVYNGKRVRCYHGITRGLILNELVKLVDKKGRSIGQLFKEEINPKYNIEFYLGLEKEYENRKAKWYNYPTLDALTLFLPKWLIGRKAVRLNRDTLKRDSNLMKLMKLKLSNEKDLPNAKDMLTIEIPSVNGHTNAKSLAKIGSYFANNGSVNCKTYLSEYTTTESIGEVVEAYDEAILLKTEMTKGGFGIFKYKELEEYSNVSFYGWGGMGGSLILFSPEYQFSFAYVMNAQHLVLMSEGRAVDLLVTAFKAHVKTLTKN